MTIRSRLTVWYSSLMLVSFVIMAAVLYFELIIEPPRVKAAGHASEPMEEEILEIVAYYGIPTAFIIVFGGWLLLGKALSPLDRLAFAAERLQLDNLSEPLPRTGNGDEVDRLSGVLNATNCRLQSAIKQIHEFTIHASHELKTPLAVLHGEIETALSDPSATLSQRERYASQLDEIQRLAKIVEGLTLLAKADGGKLALSMESVPLDCLVRDSFADAQVLAQEKRITVQLEECETIVVRGDRHRLRQLLLNLTDNAIKYNWRDGWVVIALKRAGPRVELTVSNSGPGVPPAMNDKVFDRFFRGGHSATCDAEGCGLGLSIARSIVLGHCGSITFSSQPGEVTTVRVELPA